MATLRGADESAAAMRIAPAEAESCDGPEPRELPPVAAPGYVGELGLLHGIPRTATVRTRSFLRD
jgi:hypothetical protein